MASFTENIPVMTSFRPHVSQMPLVEAMSIVGRERQTKYDEGLQKIQSQIDSVAGMDIVRDVDKQYLNTKLNELTGKLRPIAAGDFSNYQLVNSVGGAINKIGKDPNVQNAVGSTARYRKEVAAMEAARKEGKSAIQNEWDFQNRSSKWLMSGNLGESYNESYTPYRDVSKKLRELTKELPEIENMGDIPFQRDNNGQIILGPDKRPIVDMAMVRLKSKGKSAERILNNFMASLDEADINQLGIDGRFHYRGATLDTFKRDAQSEYENKKKLTKDRIVEINVELKNANLNSSQKTQLEAELNNYNRILSSGQLEKEYESDLSSLNSVENVEAYKQKLYSQKYLTSLANSLAYESKQQTLETNPYWQSQMQMKNLQLEYDKLRNRQNEFALEYAFKVQGRNIEQVGKLKENLSGYSPAMSEPLSTEEINKLNLEQAQAEIVKLGDEKTAFLKQNAALLFGKTGKEDRQELEDSFKKLYDEYNVNPGKYSKDPRTKQVLEEYRAMDMQWNSKAQGYIQTFKNAQKFNERVKEAFKDKEGLTLENGEYYSPEEVYSVIKAKNELQIQSTIGSSQSRGTIKAVPKEFYDKFKGTNLEKIANAIGKANTTTSKVTGGDELIANYAKNLESSTTDQISNIMKERDQFISKQLALRSPELQNRVSRLDMKNPIIDRKVNDVLSLVELAAVEGQLDVNDKSQYDPTIVAKWRADKGDEAKTQLDYILRKRGDGTADLILKKGNEEQIIPMNSSTLQRFFPEVASVHPLQDELLLATFSDKKTSNVLGIVGDSNGAQSAKYTANELPTGISGTPLASQVRFDIEANMHNDGSANDSYSVRMYVQNPKTGKWNHDVLTYGYLDADQIMAKLAAIGPEQVNNLMNQEN